MNEKQRPGIGVGVWIIKDGKVLFGKRFRGAETGSWCPPGGSVEMFESPDDTAIRETKEETGLELRKVTFLTFVNDIIEETSKHWITLYYRADWTVGQPRDAENEIGEWGWYEWNKLPEPIFTPTRNFIKSGYNPLKFSI